MVQGAIGLMVQGAIAMKQGAKCNWSKLEIASGKLQEYKEGNTARITINLDIFGILNILIF